MWYAQIEMLTLTTERLVMRPFREQDEGALHKILSETDILKYFPNPQAPSLERVEKLIQKQQNIGKNMTTVGGLWL